jgi:hypothetical protein
VEAAWSTALMQSSSKTLTIDAKGATLPYYVQAGTTPPRGANWVGVAIVVPEDVDTSKVTDYLSCGSHEL